MCLHRSGFLAKLTTYVTGCETRALQHCMRICDIISDAYSGAFESAKVTTATAPPPTASTAVKHLPLSTSSASRSPTRGFGAAAEIAIPSKYCTRPGSEQSSGISGCMPPCTISSNPLPQTSRAAQLLEDQGPSIRNETVFETVCPPPRGTPVPSDLG